MTGGKSGLPGAVGERRSELGAAGYPLCHAETHGVGASQRQGKCYSSVDSPAVLGWVSDAMGRIS